MGFFLVDQLSILNSTAWDSVLVLLLLLTVESYFSYYVVKILEGTIV